MEKNLKEVKNLFLVQFAIVVLQKEASQLHLRGWGGGGQGVRLAIRVLVKVSV